MINYKENGHVYVPYIRRNTKDIGYVYVPYKMKTVSTSINNETVWHSNKLINLFLKIKRFFYKSKNIKNLNLNKKLIVLYSKK